MKKQNLDGINKPKSFKPKAITIKSLTSVNVDGLSKKVRKESPSPKTFVKPVGSKAQRSFISYKSFYIKKQVPVLVVIVALLLAFGGGMWTTLSTQKIAAETDGQVLGDSTTEPSSSLVVATSTPIALGPVSSVPNDVLFNMTIDQLESYMTEKMKTPELKQAEILAERKQKLKAYLQSKKSPLADISDSIAELSHWEMVLAISNSESSLGKRCYNNNCSGIGVEPGNAMWRNYKSKEEWAKDLNKLLEKRYKDWTLERMNGVYNQPGSKNWLLASKQILEDLQEQGIE